VRFFAGRFPLTQACLANLASLHGKILSPAPGLMGCCSSTWLHYILKFVPLARVTKIEAERLEGTLEERKEFQRMFREEIERQAREKKVAIRFPDQGA
jgi:hypothetical protein